jgi:HAD superfamily hydrolase (TIGR01509 family)
MKQYRGVILDVDGTLVDSNDAHARAWVAAFAEAGVEVEFAAVRRLIGMGGDKLMPEVSDFDGTDSRSEAISRRRAEIFKERYLPTLNAFRSARDLLAELRGRGLRLAVASSAKKDELGPLLDVVGAQDLIEARTSADDAAESKPDPDIVLAALRSLNMAPPEVVMLGDTPYDLAACQKAGIAMIGLRSGGWGEADLAGCVAVYANCADLLAHLDDSPLGAGGKATSAG